MPIQERSPRDCFNKFAEHMRSLVASTLTPVPLQLMASSNSEDERALSFRDRGGAIAVPLKTRYGRLYLHLAQHLRAEYEKKQKRYRLTTQRYWYRVQLGPRLDARALFRWEYVSSERGHRPCRHHLQQNHTIHLRDGVNVDLDKIHLPTGWVTIEEVIRFLIVDMHVKPLCGDSWPDLLEASERMFYEEFTSKRYRPDE